MLENTEKSFDNHSDGCLQLLLMCYDISKTIVFWTNVLLILYTAINENGIGFFGFAVQRICSIFQPRPLNTEHFKYDTMLLRQLNHQKQIQLEKLASEHRALLSKNKTPIERFCDMLAEALDFVLNTKSHCRRRYGDDSEDAVSIPSSKRATKDLRLFRNLNTPTEAIESTQQLLCENCANEIRIEI